MDKHGKLIHEAWDSNDSTGEYSVVVGDRFTVNVDGLADLRTEGV